MKSKIVFLLLSITALLLTACNQGNADEKETKVLRLGHIQSESNAWHKGSLKFAELVEEKTDGSVKVEVYPSSTLGEDRDLVEGMQIGTVDFALVAGVMSNFYEPYSILELPYLFHDLGHLEEFVYGDEGKRLQDDMLEETGVRGLEFWLRGPRELTTNRLVEKPEDLRGIKIRVPNIEASVEGWKAMGASPTPMNFGEVYSSLQTGVIDAQENPIEFTASARIQEVQDYLVMTDHVFGYVQLLMSDKTFEGLTEDERDAVLEAAEEARNYQNDLVFQEEEEAVQAMLDADVEIVEVDQEPFREAVQDINEKLADKYGRELYDTIQGMRE
ncbi:TRAP transporter substrate-binding protein [Oceanobacillus sojae]|uniref:TRAP transporter substrate-binding protein n=1 Tax=Oceanobacillus sojae TaxID=582851 RepID=UPI000988730B|nr:TRAP transporter substrate-binding protein [Oceanobacillus sojae]MCT1901438.1 TRAP transporter substrate-binding protein [Oceanobacillus sojae]